MASTIIGGVSSGLQKIPAGEFKIEGSLTFPVGVLGVDPKPVVNFALENMPFSTRVVTHLNVGLSDSGRDLDMAILGPLFPLYMDPAYPSSGAASVFTQNLQSIIVRCKKGAGLLHVNLDVAGTPDTRVAPIPLHENGLFVYRLPKREHPYTVLGAVGRPTNVVLFGLFMRTFEEDNEFEIIALR